VGDAHDRLGAEGGSEGAEEGGSSGGDELFFDVGGVRGEAAEEVGGGGRGDGEAAVGAVDHTAAYIERRAVPVDGLAGLGECLGFESVDAGAGGYDVDDGVDRAYFVEVDLLDVYVVDFGFGGAEEFEGADGGLFDGGGEVCGLDKGADDVQGAAVCVFVGLRVAMAMRFVVSMRVFVRVAGLVEVLGFGLVLVGGLFLLFYHLLVRVGVRLCVRVAVGLRVGLAVGVRKGGCFGQLVAFEDVDFGAGDSAAVYFLDLERGAEVEGGGGFVEDGGVDAGVEEGSEEHVAADAGEAIEVGDAHGASLPSR
jgi:hypothetical protein